MIVGRFLTSLSFHKIRRFIHRVIPNEEQEHTPQQTWSMVTTEDSQCYEEKALGMGAEWQRGPHLFEEPARLGDRGIGVSLHGV